MANQSSGQAEESAFQAQSTFDKVVFYQRFGGHGFSGSDLRPGIAIGFLHGSITFNGLSESRFSGFLGGHEFSCFQAHIATSPSLQAILIAEQIFLRLASFFSAGFGIVEQELLAIFQQIEQERQADIAEILQVIHGKEPTGSAWVSCHESQIALFRAFRVPVQVVLRLGGLTVLINPKEAGIETESGVLEIVWIATEKGDVKFRCENEPDVGVFLVSVECVTAALIKGDHVVTHLILGRSGLFDLSHFGAFGGIGFGIVRVFRHSSKHFCRYVTDINQNIQFQVRRFEFFSLGFGNEADLVIVFLFGRELLECIGTDVMVGHDQSIGGNERAGSSIIKADSRTSQLIDPSLGWFEPVFLFKLLEWKVVKDPHAFIGLNHAADSHTERRQKGELQCHSNHAQCSCVNQTVGFKSIFPEGQVGSNCVGDKIFLTPWF